MNKNYFFTLICICVASISFSQIPELDVRNNASNAQSGIEKARLAYDKGDYITAEALLYSELERGNFSPNDFLLFANTLNVDNKPSLAKEFYMEYANETGNKNAQSQIQRMFKSATTNGLQSEVETKYPITNPKSYGSKLYAEIDGRMMSYNKSCDGELNNRAEVLDGLLDSPLGSVTFFDNGEKAVASVLDTKQNTSRLFVFCKKKGVWKKPKELFAEIPGNFAFPFIDEENKTMYFSSDKSGSLGGYDIYKSVYSSIDFESPINLGSEINSAGNDINPTLIEDWLYFSSNGHISKGGYDIFKFKKLSENNSLFINALDLNTTSNELAVVANGSQSILVNRVNKEGSKLVRLSKPNVVSSISGNITDESGNPIEGAFVLFNTASEQGDFTTTGSDGKYSFKSELNLPTISGQVMADGYETKSFNTAKGENASLQLVKMKPLEIIKEVEKVVVKTVPSTTSVISTPNTGASTVPTTQTQVLESRPKEVLISENVDETMTASSRPDRGLYYIVIGSTYDYAQAYDFWTKWLPTFSGAEILEYGNGLYRIGYFAGTDENQASKSYNEARKYKKDVWILRPKN